MTLYIKKIVMIFFKFLVFFNKVIWNPDRLSLRNFKQLTLLAYLSSFFLIRVPDSLSFEFKTSNEMQ